MASRGVRVKVRVEVGPSSAEFETLVSSPDLNAWQETPPHTVYAEASKLFMHATNMLIPKTVLTDD